MQLLQGLELEQAGGQQLEEGLVLHNMFTVIATYTNKKFKLKITLTSQPGAGAGAGGGGAGALAGAAGARAGAGDPLLGIFTLFFSFLSLTLKTGLAGRTDLTGPQLSLIWPLSCSVTHLPELSGHSM